jgi:putative transposase
MVLDFSAQAALILKENVLWIYSDQLEQKAADELTEIVVGYQSEHKSLHILTLETTKQDHVLYYVPLSSGYSLAILFDPEISFNSIKERSKELTKYLPYDQLYLIKAEADDKDNGPPPAKKDGLISKTWPLGNKGKKSNEKNKRRAQEPGTTQLGLFETTPGETSELEETRVSERTQREYSQAEDLGENSNVDVALMGNKTEDDNPDYLTEMMGQVRLEPTVPRVYHLPYACLLIPRMSSHYLVGDISKYLADWLLDICQSYTWRLEIMAIRPEYMQWVVSVMPTTSPGNLMRIVRRQTSRKIFDEFPRLKRENPSGDFWAPGYLVMAGSHLHPVHMVNGYIKQTRQQQGINRN